MEVLDQESQSRLFWIDPEGEWAEVASKSFRFSSRKELFDFLENEGNGSDSRTQASFFLEKIGQKWSLVSLSQPDHQPLAIDFLSSEWRRRLSQSQKKENLIKAFGRSSEQAQILDATCGLGGDAFRLSRSFKKVLSLERNAGLYALVKDARDRFFSNQENSNWDLLKKDFFDLTREEVKGLSHVYLDPMFPAKSKSSLPSKEMQFLAKLLPRDERPVEDYLRKAKDLGFQKMILKRPAQNQDLDFEKPSHQLKGQAVQFLIWALNELEP